jgi:hypothetical protein
MLLSLFSLSLRASVETFARLTIPIQGDGFEEIALPHHYSSVIFAHTSGFHGVVGTGEFHVRQFGIVNASYDAIGAYFGENPGKVRLYGRNTATVVVYALTPPTNCDTFWITSSATDTFSLGGSFANGTLSPARTACLWYLNEGPATATVRRAGRDSLHVYTSHLAGAEAKDGDVALPGPITLFTYRPADALSALSVAFRGGAQRLPVVHARMRRRSADFVIHAQRGALPSDRSLLGRDLREAVSRVTALIALASVGIGGVIASSRGVMASVGTAAARRKPVVAVAAFAPGASVGADREDVVNTAAFFPEASPS